MISLSRRMKAFLIAESMDEGLGYVVEGSARADL